MRDIQFVSICLVVSVVLLVCPFVAGQEEDEDVEEFPGAVEIACYQPFVTEITVTDPKTKSVCTTQSPSCVLSSRNLEIKVAFENPDNDVVLIIYETSGGTVTGSKEKAVWDLTSVDPGYYRLTACADNGGGCMSEQKYIDVFVDSAKPEPTVSNETKGGVVVTVTSDRLKWNLIENSPPFTTFFVSDKNWVSSCVGGCENGEGLIGLSVGAIDPEEDVLTFEYKTTYGKIIGNGPNVNWDLSSARPGVYTVEVCVDDGSGCKDLKRWTKLEVTVR